MAKATAIFTYSIGRKIVMAITGLFLISFLLVHMSGNLQLFTQNPVAFNEYTRFMTTSPLIKASEFILIAGFLLHIFFAWKLTKSNAAARPQKYAYEKEAASSSWMSRNMGLTGSIILIFLGIHLYMFYGMYHYGEGVSVDAQTAFAQTWKIAQDQTFPVNGGTVSVHEGGFLTEETAKLLGNQQVKAISMYNVASEAFKQWWIVLFYVASMTLLALHLRHGFQSAFRTLGLVHLKYTPLIEMAGTAFCILVPLLFALMPIYHFFLR